MRSNPDIARRAAGCAICSLVCSWLVVYSWPASGGMPHVPGPPAGKGVVYAKVILPSRAPAEVKPPRVESWIVRKMQGRGIDEYRVVTGWVPLAEEDEDAVTVWNAKLDGEQWGCPVVGRVVHRTADEKVTVQLEGWAPFAVEIRGTTMSADTGSRRIAVVDQGSAYVALFVGLPPVEARTLAGKKVE